MPTPFPGMDPYLEDPAVWEEFHHVFITECMYFLSDRLPASYIAKIVERVQLISMGDEAATQYIPDVAVGRGRTIATPPDQPAEGGATAIAVAPLTIPAIDSVEVKEGYIEILRLPGHDLITSIEVLSPANKYGEGIGEYRHKRRALVGAGVHVVEIDLLRRGTRTELARPLPAGQYYAFVFRADRRPDVDVYPWALRDPFPMLRVPLKAPDTDLLLDLAAIIGSTYDRGRYSRKLQNVDALPGPLSKEDAAWAERVAALRA